MSNKRFFWLKLKEDFFESDTMTWLEEQPNGKDYSLLYLKLCLKSIKTNGILIRKVGSMLLPYDAQTLSKMTNTDHDTVLVALELYKRIGLIEVLDNGAIYLTELDQMVGSETNKAQLMRNKREREKQNKISGNNVTKQLPNSYTDIDTDKEKEKEIDLDKDLDLEKKKEIDLAYETVSELYNDICISLPKVKRMTQKRKEAITRLIQLGFTIDDLKEIFQKAEESSFLKGNNNNKWCASFDWLIREENAAKVIEDNYTDKVKKVENNNSSNPFVALALEMGANNE